MLLSTRHFCFIWSLSCGYGDINFHYGRSKVIVNVLECVSKVLCESDLTGEAARVYLRGRLTPSTPVRRKGFRKDILILTSLYDLALHKTVIEYP